MACRTPAAFVIAPVAPGVRAEGVSTLASAPAANEPWSLADRFQLACWARARVPVATAITSSSAAPPWRSGCRLTCLDHADVVLEIPRPAHYAPALGEE